MDTSLAPQTTPISHKMDGLQPNNCKDSTFCEAYLVCHVCGDVIAEPTKRQVQHYKHRGRAYCCKEHSRAYISLRSSQTMAVTNRKYASERMRLRNPMRLSDVREKSRNTLREMRWKPKVQGGNGKPLPVPQVLMARALGWDTEVSIKTHATHLGFPAVYKVDLGNPELKVAVEIDGNSHCSLLRKAQDKKKTDFLNGLGWMVLRFSNREVMENTEACALVVTSTISKLRIPTPI